MKRLIEVTKMQGGGDPEYKSDFMAFHQGCLMGSHIDIPNEKVLFISSPWIAWNFISEEFDKEIIEKAPNWANGVLLGEAFHVFNDGKRLRHSELTYAEILKSTLSGQAFNYLLLEEEWYKKACDDHDYFAFSYVGRGYPSLRDKILGKS